MSYDIYLKDKVTGETIQLPVKHMITGGTYCVDYDEKNDLFTPAAITDAWLNITYNYSHYYYEAASGDERFYGNSHRDKHSNLGIRGIYGKTGAESIQMIPDLADRIESKYKQNGKWIITKKTETVFKDLHGNIIDGISLLESLGDTDYKTEKIVKLVNEGANDDYWTSTAANAINPLYQLMAFAKLRPDGIWDGD